MFRQPIPGVCVRTGNMGRWFMTHRQFGREGGFCRCRPKLSMLNGIFGGSFFFSSSTRGLRTLKILINKFEDSAFRDCKSLWHRSRLFMMFIIIRSFRTVKKDSWNWKVRFYEDSLTILSKLEKNLRVLTLRTRNFDPETGVFKGKL